MASPPEPHGNVPSQTPVTTQSRGVHLDAGEGAGSIPGLATELETHALHEALDAGPSRVPVPPLTGHAWTALRHRAVSRLSTGKHLASEGLEGAARALRHTADRAGGDRGGALAACARQAASQLERASRSLDEQDFDELARAAQRFARRQPWVVVAAAFGAGALGARWAASGHEANTPPVRRRDGRVETPRSAVARSDGDSPLPTVFAAAGLAYLIYRSHAADREPAWHEAWRPAYDCHDSQMQPDSSEAAATAGRVSSMGHQVSTMASRAGRSVRDQPLGFALAALVAGLAVGVAAQRRGSVHRGQLAGGRADWTASGLR